MIQKILVANRGEIARRVFATCRKLGIQTVAVFSDADADLPYVAEADLAVRLPGNTPSETYLRTDLIIEAARKTGADAIHPGYGFLSENADFAQAVLTAGLRWIGPTPISMEQMGSKISAKTLLGAAGVPVLPDLTPETATAADLPLLVKASAGGGGRGMRVVTDLASLANEIALASAEAASAFGDGTVFVEPYVEQGRHIEVQVLGDQHGNVFVLGERDCSIQRRHQKVLEESPAPGLTEAQREALHEAAKQAAVAIAYQGAGTVEFLVDAIDPSRFWFLEMNTRLQVEHPVTECVTGQDLVALQIQVAEGKPVDLAELHIEGHSVEVRLYAEDPSQDWQPQSGQLLSFAIPHQVEFCVPDTFGVRLDSGFVAGNQVSTHYDAMLAKVIVWGANREAAFRSLAGVLQQAEIHGLVTNRELLTKLLTDRQVLDADLSTNLFAKRPDLRELTTDPDLVMVGFAAAILETETARANAALRLPPAWRNVVSQPQQTKFLTSANSELTVSWYGGRTGYQSADQDDIQVVSVQPDLVVLEVAGVQQRVKLLAKLGAQRHYSVAGRPVSLQVLPRFTDPADQVAAGSLLAPMPGTVIQVLTEPGQRVSAGTSLLVLEAMKMQHQISVPAAGVVTEISVQVGSQVSAGQVLAVVEGETE